MSGKLTLRDILIKGLIVVIMGVIFITIFLLKTNIIAFNYTSPKIIRNLFKNLILLYGLYFLFSILSGIGILIRQETYPLKFTLITLAIATLIVILTASII